MSDLVKICNRALEYSFYLLFFLVPLMMTPFNYELFEFNKMMLVYFLTAIIVVAWLIKMVVAKKIIFRRTFWDIPLLIFLITQLLSFFFSIDRHTSLWGYYSRFHGGLFSTITYLFLYWAFVSNTADTSDGGPELVEGAPPRWRVVNNCLFAILSSATLVSLYGIAEHFGIDAQYWVQDVQNRVFSTLGQPNWLAAYLVGLMPIAWALALPNSKFRIYNLKFYILHFTFYICLLFTKSRSGLLGFAVAYFVFWGLTLIPKILQKRPAIATSFCKKFLLTTALLALITLFIGTPWTPTAPPQPDSQPTTQPSPPPLISESGDIRKIVWEGAKEIWRHYPLFGTGVETFAYSYYWYRPREHNDLSEWDFLYNKAHNEYLNFLATTGIFGLGSYLLLIAAFLISNFKFLNSKLVIALLAGFASILITNFFGFSVVPVGLFFFLFPAMSVVLASPTRGVNRNTPLRCASTYTLGIGQKLAIGAILLSLLITHYSLLKLWYADTLFAKGEKFNKANQYDNAFDFLQKAVQLWPSEPFYHNELSFTLANLASFSFNQNQATLSAQLAELAIAESGQALKTSPYNLNFWKNRARVFYALAEIDEKYNQDALDALLTASELAPTDAKIFYNLGLMYANMGQDETAIKTLEKTIELKPNYETARYSLALFYEEKGEINEARLQLEYILEKINPENESAKEKLESL